jgi:hypothetical protein
MTHVTTRLVARLVTDTESRYRLGLVDRQTRFVTAAAPPSQAQGRGDT